MTAALGKILILDLDGVGAGAFQKPHRALHIERIAVAGVGIDDEMRTDAVADQRYRLHDLAHAHQADIRASEPRIGDGGAGHVERFEACALGDERGQGVVNAGRDQDRRPRKTGRQSCFDHAQSPKVQSPR